MLFKALIFLVTVGTLLTQHTTTQLRDISWQNDIQAINNQENDDIIDLLYSIRLLATDGETQTGSGGGSTDGETQTRSGGGSTDGETSQSGGSGDSADGEDTDGSNQPVDGEDGESNDANSSICSNSQKDFDSDLIQQNINIDDQGSGNVIYTITVEYQAGKVLEECLTNKVSINEKDFTSIAYNADVLTITIAKGDLENFCFKDVDGENDSVEFKCEIEAMLFDGDKLWNLQAFDFSTEFNVALDTLKNTGGIGNVQSVGNIEDCCENSLNIESGMASCESESTCNGATDTPTTVDKGSDFIFEIQITSLAHQIYYLKDPVVIIDDKKTAKIKSFVNSTPGKMEITLVLNFDGAQAKLSVIANVAESLRRRLAIPSDYKLKWDMIVASSDPNDGVLNANECYQKYSKFDDSLTDRKVVSELDNGSHIFKFDITYQTDTIFTECLTHKIEIQNNEHATFTYLSDVLKYQLTTSDLQSTYGCLEEKNEAEGYIQFTCINTIMLYLDSKLWHINSFDFVPKYNLELTSVISGLQIQNSQNSSDLISCCENPLGIASSVATCESAGTCNGDPASPDPIVNGDSFTFQIKIDTPDFKTYYIKNPVVILNDVILVTPESFDNSVAGQMEITIKPRIVDDNAKIAVIAQVSKVQRRTLQQSISDDDNYRMRWQISLQIKNDKIDDDQIKRNNSNDGKDKKDSKNTTVMITLIAVGVCIFVVGFAACGISYYRKKFQEKTHEDLQVVPMETINIYGKENHLDTDNDVSQNTIGIIKL